MSRETDSSSSGPQGRGGSSYPPGTEPYGTGASGPAGENSDADEATVSGADPAAGAQRRPDERKTETTLTTRIRINIPGSRPIPPVVMRTTVSDSETAGGVSDLPGASGVPGGSGGTLGGAAGALGGGAVGGAIGGAEPLRPRMADEDGRSGAAPAQSDANGANGGYGSDGGGTGGAGSSDDASSRTGEFRQQTSEWFAPRKGKAGSAGDSGTAAPGSGPSYDTGDPYGVGDPYGSSDLYGSGAPYGSGPGDPYDTGAYPHVQSETPADGFPSVGGLGDPGGPAGTAGGGGPTTGPATGDMPLPPRPGAGSAPGEPAASSTLGLGTGRAPFAPGGIGEEMFPGSAAGSGGPDDARISGGTVVSGIPRVPSSGSGAASSPFQGAASAPRTSTNTSAGRGRTAGRGADAESGGRSKLMLVGVGLAGLIGIAYGAGLLLDHADVPTGTTVLGIDIGGTTKHDAINKLDAALGDRTTKPFTVVAGEKQAQLKPSVAGLTLDTEATVRDAAGRDYNPVSVIGSLFGAERQAEPALRVDKEKMASALTHVSQETGDGGAPKDGMVKFAKGKAVAVPGKPHRGIDPADASAVLQKAYRARAATGKDGAVKLPVSMQQPKVGRQELRRAIKSFGKPAMSGLVTVKVGSASIQFSPAKSLPKFLSMKPVNGTLVDTYNLPVLQKLYGTTFAGVRITRGDGSKTPVMPQDVAGALRLALKETTPSKRVQEIPTNPQ